MKFVEDKVYTPTGQITEISFYFGYEAVYFACKYPDKIITNAAKYNEFDKSTNKDIQKIGELPGIKELMEYIYQDFDPEKVKNYFENWKIDEHWKIDIDGNSLKPKYSELTSSNSKLFDYYTIISTIIKQIIMKICNITKIKDIPSHIHQ